MTIEVTYASCFNTKQFKQLKTILQQLVDSREHRPLESTILKRLPKELLPYWYAIPGRKPKYKLESFLGNGFPACEQCNKLLEKPSYYCSRTCMGLGRAETRKDSRTTALKFIEENTTKTPYVLSPLDVKQFSRVLKGMDKCNDEYSVICKLLDQDVSLARRFINVRATSGTGKFLLCTGQLLEQKCLTCNKPIPVKFSDDGEQNLTKHCDPKCRANDPKVRAKKKATTVESFGVDHPWKNKDIQQDRKDTCFVRYGAENPMQNKVIFERQQAAATSLRYKKKTITLNGKLVEVQGFEPQAIKYILSKGIKEKDIVIGLKVPVIPYILNGKAKVYYPDLFY